MWEVTGAISEELQEAIRSHLKYNCQFTFEGPFRLTGEPAPFYGAALLCQLALLPSSSYKNARKTKVLDTEATFYFLFRTVDADEVLIPLTGGEGDVLLAKRWLGLDLHDDAQRLKYARFYYAFALTERPPQFRNVPCNISDLRFDKPVTEQRIWGIYGATWRFVDPERLDVHVHFERRGAFWFVCHRAHLPMQFGNELFDVDLRIWRSDGHISCKKTSLIYQDTALAEEPRLRPGKIRPPSYITWHERWLTLYRNCAAFVNQTVYLVAFAGLVIASALALALPLDLWGISPPRILLDLLSGATEGGNWKDWLGIASFYCIGYFVLTTVLVLDLETMRSALLTWSPRFKESRLNELLFSIAQKSRRFENGYRRGLFRRISVAATRLVLWTVYIVCVFTSLQVSIRPRLAADLKALKDVTQVFGGEQAFLYVPVVFYYVGRKSLEPEKIALVSFWILVGLQLTMGLLVVRRIHRYWASTAAAKLNEQIVRAPAPTAPTIRQA